MVRMIDVKQKISKETAFGWILWQSLWSHTSVLLCVTFGVVRLCSLTFYGTVCFESNKVKLKLSFLCIVQYIYSLKQVSINNSQTTKESIPCLNKIMDRKSVSACVSYKWQITMYSHSGGFSRHDFVIHKSLIGTCYNKFVRHKWPWLCPQTSKFS